MLEIRYNKTTKQLTGWWSGAFGNYDIKLSGRPNEAMATLDTAAPGKPLEAWLYDEANNFLVANPAYVSPDIANQKRKEARIRMVTAILAIKDNADASPWGQILYDMAIAQGWVESF